MEDRADLAELWIEAFELNGCQVLHCLNATVAIDALETQRFDLIVTDMFVPGDKGGLHLLAKLATLRNAPPVIAVTGAPGPLTTASDSNQVNFFLAQAQRLGAMATLEKPFSISTLIETAQALWEYQQKRA